MVRPRRMNLRKAIADGYVTRASTLAELAAALQIDAKGLAETVARHNGFAATGVDLDFAKGSDVYQRNLGDAAHTPNPCIGPIATPPFYAVQLHASELGASAGLVTNEFAQVLRSDGTPIARPLRLRQRHGFDDGRHLSRPRHHAGPRHDLRLHRGQPRRSDAGLSPASVVTHALR